MTPQNLRHRFDSQSSDLTDDSVEIRAIGLCSNMCNNVVNNDNGTACESHHSGSNYSNDGVDIPDLLEALFDLKFLPFSNNNCLETTSTSTTTASLDDNIECQTRYRLQTSLNLVSTHKQKLSHLQNEASILQSTAADVSRNVDELSMKIKKLHDIMTQYSMALETERDRLERCTIERCCVMRETEDLEERIQQMEDRIVDDKRLLNDLTNRRRHCDVTRAITQTEQERLDERDVFYDAWEEISGEGMGDGWISCDEKEEDLLVLPSQPYHIRIDDLDIPELVSSSSQSTNNGDYNLTNYPLHANNMITSRIISSLLSYGLSLTNTESGWIPTKDTEAFLNKLKTHNNNNHHHNEHKNILIWHKKLPDCDYPLVKSRGIVKTTPEQLMELLVDSSRCHEYNSMNRGRTDEHFFTRGYKNNKRGDCKGCRGETKIIKSVNKIPLVGGMVENLSLIHITELRNDDTNNVYNDDGGGGEYVAVSRAVCETAHGEQPATTSTMRTEILLGVNLVKKYKSCNESSDNNNEQWCEFTNVTQVYVPGVPLFLGKKVGLNSARNYIRDIQNVWK